MDIIKDVSKITKKMGDGAMSIARKSGDIVEITKLNSMISSEEEKIEKEFTKTGRILFEKFTAGEQVDPDLSERCNNIAIMKNNIADYKQRILELKGIKYCPQCGLQLSINIKFCPECGAKQEMPKIEAENEDQEDTDTQDNNLTDDNADKEE